MPRYLALTVDHEVFGNGTGDVRQHVTEPTERMCRIAESYQVPVTIFFELEEYLQFEIHREGLRRLLGYDPADEMRRQATDLAQRGHDIQLHLHPQWYGARFGDGGWELHHHRLTVDALFENQDETTAFIRQRREQLEEISGRPVVAYRAGGFAAQPGTRLLKGLEETGFTIESSVVKGMYRSRPHPLDYRAVPADRRLWRISDEVSQENVNGRLWEIPVHSVMGRRYQQLTFDRVKAKFSRSIPKGRQREMMSELGMKKTPGGLLSFLWQPVPIKLDYHNLSPARLYRMIKRAPVPPACDLDVLVLIGHSKEHISDSRFEDFLKLVSADPELKFVSFSDIAYKLRNPSAAGEGENFGSPTPQYAGCGGS